MDSEKAKNIKKVLNTWKIVFHGITNADILTYINELESENKELKKYRCDWLNSEKMHLQADLEDTEFELASSNKILEEVNKENQQLKDRIAELEKENADYKDTNNILRTRIDKSKELSRRNGELLLKQFAERLKIESVNKIHETLKEFLL